MSELGDRLAGGLAREALAAQVTEAAGAVAKAMAHAAASVTADRLLDAEEDLGAALQWIDWARDLVVVGRLGRPAP